MQKHWIKLVHNIILKRVMMIFTTEKGLHFQILMEVLVFCLNKEVLEGHAQETSNGILTFPFTIRNQYTAAMSTLEAAKKYACKKS